MPGVPAGVGAVGGRGGGVAAAREVAAEDSGEGARVVSERAGVGGEWGCAVNWTSNAQWPKGLICQRRANDKTTDFHPTEAAARAVCRMLERDGLGGEGKVFPLRTWVEDTSNDKAETRRQTPPERNA